MDYYSILNLNREPFSNSPDPDYFFKSRQHFSCLQKIELALRLRRGLNVVIGEVGTGKTTLCRQLIRRLSQDDLMETHLILDPSFNTAHEFLARFAEMLSGIKPPIGSDPWQLKEHIKNILYFKGIEKQKIVVLIIDEGQKTPSFCIEVLREFLNYETNEFKLLQIVIFAQEEFVQLLVVHANFSDRVNFFTTLTPLNFQDTRLLIEYRLRKSSGEVKYPTLFTLPAYWVIYRKSKGYPRRIIHLCHQSLMAMIIQNRQRIGRDLVKSCAKRSMPYTGARFSGSHYVAIFVLLLALIGGTMAAHKNKLHLPAFVSTVSRHPVPVPNSEKIVADQNHNRPATSSQSAQKPEVQAPDKHLNQKNMPPFVLGALTVAQGDNLSDLIRLVYGEPTDEYIESLLTLNPNIIDADALTVGAVIQFPATAVEVTPDDRKIYRIELDNRTTLAAARKAFNALKAKYGNLRMTAYWTAEAGLRFSIFWPEFFIQANLAQKSLDSKQRELGARGKVVRDWTAETLFFSDPFLENRHQIG